MISSGVAPALRATWMCCRKPGAYMWVMDVSKCDADQPANLGCGDAALVAVEGLNSSRSRAGRGRERIPTPCSIGLIGSHGITGRGGFTAWDACRIHSCRLLSLRAGWGRPDGRNGRFARSQFEYEDYRAWRLHPATRRMLAARAGLVEVAVQELYRQEGD